MKKRVVSKPKPTYLIEVDKDDVMEIMRERYEN